MVVREIGQVRPRKLAAITATLLLLAGGTTVVVGDGDTAEAGAVDGELRATLGVFREVRTAGDDLPGNPVEALSRAGDLQPGESIGLSRRVPYEAGDAFLWPMNGGVCHTSPAGSGCVPTRVVAEKGLAVGVQAELDLRSRTYEDARVFGIARDGIAAVRLRLHDGRTVSTAVRQNTFLALDLPDRPAEVTWSDDGGTHSIPVPGQSAEALAAEIAGP